MRNVAASIAAVVVFLLAPPARAQETGDALVEQAMCYACHQMNTASLGPPWQAIAARHAGQKELMTEVLASKIVRGGGGNWGLVPMVPNQRVTAEEARIMAAWVLEQAPD